MVLILTSVNEIEKFADYTLSFPAFLLSENMDQGGGVLELHTQELKMPHAMIMQDFGR